MPHQDKAGTIRIHNLRKSEIEELGNLISSRQDLPQDTCEFIEERVEEGRLGEPATFVAVTLLTSAAIAVIGAWLLKKRTATIVRYVFEVEYPDGTKQTTRLDITQQASEPPPAELLKQLESLTRIPAKEIKGLME